MNKLPKLRKVDTSKPPKKKVLLLSDDIRLPSGVGTMSREMVYGTVATYDWVQIGGAINHQDQGKVFDMSQDAATVTGVGDASVKVYCASGYGNPDVLRQILLIEKPDIIVHFTDPRFWDWLYNMEHEIRQTIPIAYLNIWDDLPAPHWNRNAYESCDLLMAISKQTYNLNRMVLGHGYYESEDKTDDVNRMKLVGNTGQEAPWRPIPLLTYVPHGIDTDTFTPLKSTDPTLAKVKQAIFGNKDPKFVAFFNSRNVRRKCPSNLILAFKLMVDSLPEEQRSDCYLLMHTDPVDQHGTDLPAVAQALAPDVNIIFSNRKISTTELNCLYNLADVTCNPSSAEGFGLSHMESLMAGTPTIATVIGGLQDQMGFTKDGKELTVNDFTDAVASNSSGNITTEHGNWVYPLWPIYNLQGSPATPYIYDSIAPITSLRDGLKYWYLKGDDHRIKAGAAGRSWSIKNGFTKENMCSRTVYSLDMCMDRFHPRNKFSVIDVSHKEDVTYTNCTLL